MDPTTATKAGYSRIGLHLVLAEERNGHKYGFSFFFFFFLPPFPSSPSFGCT